MAEHSSRQRPHPRLLLIPLAIAVLGYGGWELWKTRQPLHTLVISGRIEGYDTDLAPKVTARVLRIVPREGDPVRRGELLVELDSRDLRAQVEAAQAQLAEAQFQAAQSRTVTGPQGKAADEAESARAQVAQADAQLQLAIAQEKLAQVKRNRYTRLSREGAVNQQLADEAQTALETAIATRMAQESALQAAQRQFDSLQTHVPAAAARYQASLRSVQRAQADLRQAKTRLSETQLVSPLDGVVTLRALEPGALASPGQTVLSILDPLTVYLRGFVPEDDIGRVHLGQRATIHLDADPSRPLAGKVSAVDAMASFTPETIYFQKDRVKQVFGVRIAVDPSSGLAKPGMPAAAEIQLDTHPL
jgi:HlyD family secretion protein